MTTERRQCSGTTRAGKQCKLLVGPARVFCDRHLPHFLRTDDDAIMVSRAVRELGMLKEGERPVIMHFRDCPRLRDGKSDSCTCGRVRIEWPDHDQLEVPHPMGAKTTPAMQDREST